MPKSQGIRLVGPALIVATLLCVACTATAETRSEKADTLLSRLIQTNDPGVAVLVAQDGKILFEKGYGLADLEHHVPVTPQTIFRIGSVTKQFTATAILKLQEEGRLGIDDKLSKYIPDFPRADEVTLRELMDHTSGIHDYVPSHLSDLAKPTTTEAIIKEIEKHPYDFAPGTQWRYDNSGYTLLGYIVEKVSGQSYGDFLRENLFKPLGMTNTGVYRAHLGLRLEAVGYSLGPKGPEPAFFIDPSWNGGDGALYSTVEDLYRWNEGIFKGRVLDAASLEAAFTPVPTEAGQLNPGNGYGFGWFLGRYRGLRDISHGGSVPGFSCMLLRLPEEKFTVVVLANAEPGRTNATAQILAYQMVDIYLADKLTPNKIAKTNDR